MTSNVSTIGFIKLMKYFRNVILQDACLLKDMFRNHPVFKVGLFDNPEFVKFSKVVRDSEAAVAGKVFGEEVLRVLPELGNTVGTRLLALEKKVGNLLDLVRCGGTVTATTTSTFRFDAPRVDDNDREQAMPVYSMARAITTVREVYTEFRIGLSGGPSLESLEADHGAAWRRGRGDSQRFCRRKKIVMAVEAYSKRFKVDEIEACCAFDRFLEKENKSIDWLAKSNALHLIQFD